MTSVDTRSQEGRPVNTDHIAIGEMIVANNGGTFDTTEGFPTPLDAPPDADHPWVVTIKPESTRQLSLSDLQDWPEPYVATVLGELTVQYAGQHYPNNVGAWVDDKRVVHWDVVGFYDLEKATEMAQLFGELAIYNLATGETVHI